MATVGSLLSPVDFSSQGQLVSFSVPDMNYLLLSGHYVKLDND